MLSNVETGQCRGGCPLGDTRSFMFEWTRGLMDNGSEMDIGEPSSNFRQFRYIQLRTYTLWNGINPHRLP